MTRRRALALAALLATSAWLSCQRARAQSEDEGRARVGTSMGAGVGTLALVRPTAEGRQRLPSSAFVALDLGIGLHVGADRPLSLEVAIAYLSSLDFALAADPLFGLTQDVAVRVQRAELSFAPRVKLGNERDSLALAFPLGVVLRSVVPELHQFGLPNYVLAGPELRIELLWSLGDQVHLRIGPEVQWLALVDHSLRAQGACCQGAALGAQGSLEASLGSTFSVALQLRESHAFVAQGVRAFSEVERFATAVMAGRL